MWHVRVRLASFVAVCGPDLHPCDYKVRKTMKQWSEDPWYQWTEVVTDWSTADCHSSSYQWMAQTSASYTRDGRLKILFSFQRIYPVEEMTALSPSDNVEITFCINFTEFVVWPHAEGLMHYFMYCAKIKSIIIQRDIFVECRLNVVRFC